MPAVKWRQYRHQEGDPRDWFYARHASFICKTWLIKKKCIYLQYNGGGGTSWRWWHFWVIHMWDMTHSYVTRDSFVAYVCSKMAAVSSSRWQLSWLIHMWDMTPLYVRRDWFIEKMAAVSSSRWRLSWNIHMWDMTPLHVRRDLFIENACSKMAAVSSSRWWLSWNSRSNSARSCTICRHT